MTDKPQQMDLMPEAGSDASSLVECLGQTFPSEAARRDHYLTRLRAALEELNAKLGGVTWTTIDDAVTRLSTLEHWQLGDGDRLRELAERMREAARGQGRGKDLLQLWKDEVGFPHGEMDDILRLSDPPYYTACPNPFIGEFIAFYGKPYDPATSDYRREPFAADVSEGKNDPIYNAHSYHTKVPHKAIMHYILHYTQPGDVVIDGFCGTGMTGVAAQLCGDSSIVQSLGYQVLKDGAVVDSAGVHISRLGSRAAIISDLSTAATYISYNYNVPLDPQVYEQQANRILSQVSRQIGWMYWTLHRPSPDVIEESLKLVSSLKEGSEKPINISFGRINYIVWSDVFICPTCSNEVVFWSEAVDKARGKVLDSFPCPSCGSLLTKRNMERAWITEYDPLTRDTSRRPKQVPVRINYSVGTTRYEKEPDAFDLALIQHIEHIDISYRVPHEPLPDGDKTHDPSSVGVTHAHHFYTRSSLIWLAQMFSMQQSDQRSSWATFSIVNTISKLYRYTPKKPDYKGQGGGILTGTLYVPALIRALSAPSSYERSVARLGRALVSLKSISKRPRALISTNSASHLSIPSESVDYIFTDPPFGGNLMYSELNFLWEAWLRVFTDNRPEAIENSSQGKKLLDYQSLMTFCFQEYYRVLKPGRWITIEFHNSRNSVWNAIQEALQHAGFVIADVRTLDKQQTTFNQVTGAGAVKQDLVISAYKPNGGLEDRFRIEAGTENGAWDFVRTHMRQLPVFVSKDGQVEVIAERQNYLLFDRMVAFHVQRGVTVPLSAAEFYAGLEQRFSERDGMYFLPEQVAEYDKKRMTATEVMQLTLFVTDEASAIQWLKQQLTKKPQTFQDLHPQFMRQIGGWSKHELSLELRDLLEQNFLVYDGVGEVPSQIHGYLSSNYKDLRNLAKDDARLRGDAADRWYVPDPNKAGDLEKLRERALLREFAEYRESKARKLKVFRLEAVRAGFKKAWGERDYATILAVAEKIPDAVLQEDPKLLMWYDQALTRSGR